MKKRNVFVFGIGEKKRIENLISNLEHNGFNVVVGPSKPDHDYLYKYSEYYRKSYDEKIWAFCSDVGSVFVLSKNTGVYIDTSVVIGERLNEFFNNFIKNDVSLFKETSSSIACSVMVSGIENNEFYNGILREYLVPIQFEPRLYPILPDIISAYVCNKAYYYGFDEIKSNGLVVSELPMIRNSATIKKIGSGSGVEEKKHSFELIDNNYGYTAEKKGHRKKDFEKGKRRLHKYILSSENMLSPTPNLIRSRYDSTKSHEYEKKLIDIYNSLNYKVNVLDGMIGSRLKKALSKARKRKNE